MIDAFAPVRICDIGGWTDTWFGGPGRVVNLAVVPGVEVSIRRTDGPDGVTLEVGAFGDRYPVVPGAAREARHPLLEAAIDELPPPPGEPLEISVRSHVPAGCGAGTSAAVAVALVGALAAARAEPRSALDVAYAAHRLEVEVLGQESGIQDQLSAASGGISYLEIEPYPEANVQTLPAWPDLGPRLSLVFLGRPHDSSSVHRQVIDDVRAQRSTALNQLRDAAGAARDAVLAQDLAAFGQAMIANTEGQRGLHPELVGLDAQQVFDVAVATEAIGWKVNGAGGRGGSVTILHAAPDAKATFDARVATLNESYRVLPVEISPLGLQVRT